MAAREVVLKYLSTFDASGAQAAQAANRGVTQSINVASQAKRALSESTVDLEFKQRRVEAVTRTLGMEFANMATSGFSVASAAQAGASAIGFLGNTIKVASGPIGIAITIISSLAAALLMWKAQAEKTGTATGQLADEQDRLNRSKLEAIRLSGVESSDIAHTLAMRSRARNMDIEELEKSLELHQADQRNIEDRLEVATRTVEQSGKTAALTREIDGLTGSYVRNKASIMELKAALGVLVDQQVTTITATEISAEAYASLVGISKIAELSITDTARIEAEKRKAIAEDEAKKRVLLERQAAGNIAGIAGSLAAFMAATGSQQFGIMKGLRYAEAIINTAAAVALALGSAPPPYNYIAAAATAAAGAVQIATIASTSPGGGGGISIPSGGGGGGGGSHPAFGGGGVQMPITGGGGGGFQAGTVTIHFENIVVQVIDPDAISPAMMRKLVRRIAEGLSFELNGLRNSLQ